MRSHTFRNAIHLVASKGTVEVSRQCKTSIRDPWFVRHLQTAGTTTELLPWVDKIHVLQKVRGTSLARIHMRLGFLFLSLPGFHPHFHIV
jgi:hypothetical protein